MICKICGCRLEVVEEGIRCTYCDFEYCWTAGFCDNCEKMKTQTIRFGETDVCKECLESSNDI